MGRLVALILALVMGVGIAWRGERLPAPAPADAPATAFSAGRAMADVEAIARVPHPVASPENARVRDHLVARMADLGLSPEVRPGVGVQQPKWAKDVLIAGRVENIVGILPGRDRAAPALALMAHYDSVPGSPGAADDASGVAAILEIVRALKARGVPARDIMVVITDGEEAGLLGANHFFRRDPLARRIGLAVNLETRGGGGRAQMFQTSRENGQLIALLQRTAVEPSASSMAVFIYELMPNDTDFTEALRAGTPGLNYAFIGRQFDYHSATSTPANLDRGSLQDIGQQVLALAADAAFAPSLPGKAPDAVFSQTFGDLLVAYPAWAGWVVLAIAALLLAVAFRRARRLEPFPLTDVARGAAALLFAALSAAAFLQFARQATGAGVGYLEQRFLLAQVSRWETAVVLIGLGALLLAAAELARGRRLVALAPLAAGLACSAFGAFDPMGLGAGVGAAVLGLLAFGRPVSRPGAWAGVLSLGLLLAVAAQALAAPAAFVIAWPLLMAAIGAAATALAARRGYAALAVLAVLAAVALGWIGGFAHGAFLGMDVMPLLAVMTLLAAFGLWPLAQPADGAPPGRGLGAALLIAGLAVTAWVRFADPYDVRHPQATEVRYHVDLDARRARLASTTPDLPKWTERALSASGGQIERVSHWAFRRPVYAAPAPFVDEAAAALALTREADGSLALDAAPPADGRMLTLQLNPNTPAVLESLGGVPVGMALEPGKWSTVRWVGSPEGVRLAVRAAGPGRLDVRAAAVLPRWPAGAPALPPRPADVMAWDLSDTTLVTASQRFAW